MSNTVTEAQNPIAIETTAATPTQTGRPASSYGIASHDPSKPEVTRQIVQQLRESEINMDTLADTPIFSCVRVPAAEMLERLV